MPSIRLISVTRLSQLEQGAFYKIVGSASDGLPIPPQVFCYQGSVVSLAGQVYLTGYLWWAEGTRWRGQQTQVAPEMVNIPENGWADLHLEKIEQVRGGLIEAPSYQDIIRHRQLHGPQFKTRLPALIKETGLG